MDLINPYSIPAITALLLKLMLLWAVRVMPLRTSEGRLFLAFLSVLALHNFAEILVFNYAGPREGVILLRSGLLYFTMSVVAMAILVHLMLIRLRASTGWDISLRYRGFLYAPAGAVLLMLWGSDDMVRGFVPYGFSYTKVPGPLYGWFELYALAYLGASVTILALATLFSVNRARRRKNIITALGMAPIIIMPMAVIVLQNTGLDIFNMPLWFPLASTFFLVVMAYAIYEHRLFDVFFHLPGTRLQSRRTGFHQGIRDFLAELDRLPRISVEEAMNKLAAALQCSVALVGPGRGAVEAGPQSGDSNGIRFDRLERDKLESIDEIVLTKEVKDERPDVYSTLKGANCAAVIPFRPFSGTSAGWLLLGGRKNDPDELPIDFPMVESLFDRMGDLFLEQMVREREEVDRLQQELARLKTANERLEARLARKENAIDRLYDQHATPDGSAPPAGASLDELTAGLEKKMICETLARLKGNVSATAKSLGLTRQTLYARMDSYGIDRSKWRRRSSGG